LSMTENTGKREARLNRAFTYTFTVRNTGPGTAQLVSLNDQIPASLRINSVTASRGTCSAPIGGNGGTLSCSLGNMTLNQSATVSVNVTTLVGTGSIVLDGAVATTSTDNNQLNNSAAITMTARN
jgi:uncharacterized repeat protein (TIGR01451 family)